MSAAAQLLSVIKRLETLSKGAAGPDSNDANDLVSRLEAAVSALVLAGCFRSGSDHVAHLEHATAQLSSGSAAVAASSSRAAADAKAAQDKSAQDKVAQEKAELDKATKKARDQQAKAEQEMCESECKALEQPQAKAVGAEKAVVEKAAADKASSQSVLTGGRSAGKGASSSASGGMAAAYEAVRNDSSPEEWALFGYDGNNIIVMETGRGLDAFLERLEDEERNYGYLRCHSTNSNPTVKFALVTWIGPRVSPLKKAKVSTDKALVKQVVLQYAFELLMSDKSDLVDELKKQKLVLGK